MKGKKDINVGDLIKKIAHPGYGKIGAVIAEGVDEHQTILVNWVRVRYSDGTGYKWIQKCGIELIA